MDYLKMFVIYLIVAFLLAYFAFNNNVNFSLLIAVSGALVFLIISFIFDKVRAAK
ncbi:hypothetical protein [Kurthia sp. Dielmo]|uniref:hypothetical protein n=1 Tax=Kurthia sp. Dielmo TaxID=1033738 RepID=UPI00164553A6|nr:hypothetical protein [Kurthia sp. Dielmo]